jgi:hypothetical protein
MLFLSKDVIGIYVIWILLKITFSKIFEKDVNKDIGL